MPRAPRRRRDPELTPEEERSLLGTALSGIAYLGGAIDKPWAATRGLVGGGGLEQLLHAVPFSESLGFAPKKKYGGRELLEMAGIAPRNVKGLDPWDVAGLGLEMVLGPPLPGGPAIALTKAGRAAALGGKVAKGVPKLAAAAKQAKALGIPLGKAGAAKTGRILGSTPAAYAKEIEHGLRGMGGIFWPWPASMVLGKKPLAVFGAGSKRAARAVEAVYYGRLSPIPAVRSLFSATTRGIRGGRAQKVWEEALSLQHNALAGLDEMAPALREANEDLGRLYGDLAKHAEIAGDKTGKMAFDDAMAFISQKQSAIQGQLHMTEQEIAALFKVPGDMPEMSAKLAQFSRQASDVLDNTMADMMKEGFGKYLHLGGHGDWLDDTFAAYFPRGKLRDADAQRAIEEVRARLLSTGTPHSLHRADPLRNVPEGRLFLNRWAADSVLTKPGKLEDGLLPLRDQVRTARGWLREHGFEVSPKATARQIKREYGWRRYLEPAAGRERARLAPGPEGEKTFLDWLTDLKVGRKAIPDPETGQILRDATPAKIDQLLDYFGKLPAKPEGIFNRTWTGDFMSYMHHMAISNSNLHTVHNFLRGVAKKGDDAAVATDWISLPDAWHAVLTRNNRRALTDTGLDTLAREIGQGADNLKVPPQTAKVLQTYVDVMDPRSDVSGVFGEAYDAWTAAVKAGWTVPFVSFHTRNRVTGLFQNMAGDVPYTTKQYRDAMKACSRFTRTKGKEALPFMDEIRDMGILEHGRGLDIWVEETAEEISGRMPAGGLGWVLDPLRHPKAWLTPKVRGMPRAWREAPEGTLRRAVAQRPGEPQFALFEAGDRAYSLVEFYNRAEPYIAARWADMTPGQAQQLVKRLQYDYSKFAPFEKKLVRRFVVPFYGWMRNNIPYQLGQLFNNPGGKHAQTLRMLMAVQGQSGEYMPSWISEKLAIPLPGGREGEQAAIRQLGLPLEDLAMFQFQGRRPSTRTLSRLLSQMHPAISTPFKLYSGRDPYTGRNLKDLRGPTGVPTLDTLWQATPLTRFRTEALKAVDKRKRIPYRALSLLTGVKVGTYDPEKWRLIEQQQALDRLLEAHPAIREFRKLYLPARAKEAAPEEVKRQLDLARKLEAAQRRLREKRTAAGKR